MYDEVLVERIVKGRVKVHPRNMYKEERDEAIRRLHADGLSDGQIARQTWISERHVFRVRNNEMGLPPNRPRGVQRLRLVCPDPKRRCGVRLGPRARTACELGRNHSPDEHMGRQPSGKWMMWRRPNEGWEKR